MAPTTLRDIPAAASPMVNDGTYGHLEALANWYTFRFRPLISPGGEASVLLEAMASGLPALAVRAGGVLDFARHGGNAWLVAPDSSEAIAQGLRRLLADPGLCTELAAGALATAASRDWASVFDAVEATYQEVVAAPALPRAA